MSVTASSATEIFSAESFKDYDTFYEHIMKAIESTECEELEYKGVSVDRGSKIFEDLESNEKTAFKFPHGPYAGSAKILGYFLRIDGQRYPRLAVESGWSESWDNLFYDMKMLIVGSSEAIRAVLLLKWERIRMSDRVKGFAELYEAGTRDGAPVLKQRETIFPAPVPQTQPQQLRLERRLLFGEHVVSGQGPATILPLDIGALRQIATVALSLMDLVPA
ncbi:hypothetical protein PHISCL_06835 [Aspergillus sclerotialis]|uniref:Uncharacterized protein n=1 Tax=Aspergillus sclerotialis TaxID=2070753 RepID=A0A3A2ZCZ6_9EURO|nr:hypothetical protein PHISCL_06835 [Aspergillus sclerotialis]